MTAATAREYRRLTARGHTHDDARRELGVREDALEQALRRAGHVDLPDTRSWRDGLWRDHAACRGADPELFAPVDITKPDTVPAARETARRYCASCPVLAECGRDADSRRHSGLWAGAWRTTQPTYHRLPLIPGIQLEPLGERWRRP